MYLGRENVLKLLLLMTEIHDKKSLDVADNYLDKIYQDAWEKYGLPESGWIDNPEAGYIDDERDAFEDVIHKIVNPFNVSI